MIKKSEGQQASGSFGALPSKISQLKKEIQASRFASVREKIERNRKTVETSTFELCELSKSKNDLCSTDQNGITDKLSFRMTNPLREISGYTHGYGEKDTINCQEITFSTTIKLPHVEKIPPYTSWIFLDKNQRMAEDQSVVGRRQIYYDENGGETLISSDSEEEIPEPEEEKHKFSDGEDQMLWKVLQEYGLIEEVVNSLCQFIGATSFEIQERYNILMEKYQHKHVKKVSDDSPETIFERSTFLDKSLDATLDSIDNLFCRRCLVFDCRLHGCSQTIIVPVEKQPYWSEVEENREPCSDQCYLLTRSVTDLCKRTDTNVLCTTDASKEKNRNVLSSGNEKPSCGNLYRDITPDVRDNDGMGTDISSGPSMVPQVSDGALCNDELSTTTPSSENLVKRKVSNYVSINATLVPYDIQASSNKKQKKISCLDVYVSGNGKPDSGMISKMDTRLPGGRVPGSNLYMKMKHGKELVEHRCHGTIAIASDRSHNNIVERDANNDPEASDMEESANSQAVQDEGALNSIAWRPLEKELYLKGIEIFGKNSCLISRNLLCGLKTCIEVFTYMLKDGNAVASATLPNSCMEDNESADTNYKQHELSSRSRFFRRRGRARKLKYTSKSGAHPSTHKRIAGGKNKWNKQYTPCECKFMCGKECPCFQNVTCCEKYCGCSKSCKYRFRGCHCAKSQCRSRQCPCFAADRECDPDVCRNCWVSCGDGSLGEPPARGEDGYHCENMKLLLKQQQRILLGRSDVAGWGAFLKNSVHKNEYLGEYTGELISHKEADKRGKIYDRANSSYLFDLNDQSVLDAYRKGDKLKFANHSAKPNCYAKVKLVAGDHRVGIYAMENIEAGEELFYDYCYAPDTQYAWARKAESSKRDESPVYTGRARKHQSSQ